MAALTAARLTDQERVAVLLQAVGAAALLPAEPHGIESRIPWTDSKVVGSPDPPSPYFTKPAFERLRFGIAWASYDDVLGGVIARAAGMNRRGLPRYPKVNE